MEGSSASADASVEASMKVVEGHGRFRTFHLSFRENPLTLVSMKVSTASADDILNHNPNPNPDPGPTTHRGLIG